LIWDLEKGFALVAATRDKKVAKMIDLAVSGPADDPERDPHGRTDRIVGLSATKLGPAT